MFNMDVMRMYARTIQFKIYNVAKTSTSAINVSSVKLD